MCVEKSSAALSAHDVMQASEVNLCMLASAPISMTPASPDQVDADQLQFFGSLCTELQCSEEALIAKSCWLFETRSASWTPQFYVLFPARAQALVMFRCVM
jgi:hypothetical protein